MNRDSTPVAAATPPTARGQRTRQKLLKAAEAVFGLKGYEAASIADITRKADVALGTFYVYFPDKKSLYVELVDEMGTRLRRLIAESVAGLTDRLEVEREGFRVFFEFASKHRALYRIVRQAEFVDEAAYHRYYDKLAEGYVRGLSRAMDEGQVRRMDPEALAYCLMGIADFLGMRWVLWKNGRELDAVLETAMSLLAHGMDPSEKPRAPVKGAPRKPAR
jgi:AcrR family transcriptional regulator